MDTEVGAVVAVETSERPEGGEIMEAWRRWRARAAATVELSGCGIGVVPVGDLGERAAEAVEAAASSANAEAIEASDCTGTVSLRR